MSFSLGIPTVTIEMWTADAIVLYDWLMSVDLNAVPISHPSAKSKRSRICWPG